MATISKRLDTIQAAVNAKSGAGAVVVIYDQKTGEPLQTVPPGATLLCWIPDNGRGDY